MRFSRSAHFLLTVPLRMPASVRFPSIITETAVHAIPLLCPQFVCRLWKIPLLVQFGNGVEKVYDCATLFARPPFAPLKTAAFFRLVKVDPGGYGVSWNDDIDLSEFELWKNGRQVVHQPA
jgi:hypothetical protein